MGDYSRLEWVRAETQRGYDRAQEAYIQHIAGCPNCANDFAGCPEGLRLAQLEVRAWHAYQEWHS